MRKLILYEKMKNMWFTIVLSVQFMPNNAYEPTMFGSRLKLRKTVKQPVAPPLSLPPLLLACNSVVKCI